MNDLRQTDSEFFIDSALLAEIRKLLELYPELKRALGMPVQFRVVLDANIAISDLLHKLKKPSLKQTMIEECARAGTLLVHAPRWLDEEMTTSTIPQVAERKNLDRETILGLWSEYREIIEWDETLCAPEQLEGVIEDEKDAPYLALEKKIEAAGILSRDKHIAKMGGHTLPQDFVIVVRRYARASSVHLSIYVSGSLIGVLSVGALQALVGGLSKMISQMQPWAKWTLAAGAILAVVHPKSRKFFQKKLKSTLNLGESVAPQLLQLIDLAGQKQLEAEACLAITQDFISEPDDRSCASGSASD